MARPLLAGIALAGLTIWHCTPAAAEASAPPRKQLNSHRDIYEAIYACYRPPPLEQARPGMQITVQVTFRRDGSILGEPRITYETREATEDQRYAYRMAVAEALQRCAPLPFSDALGSAVAGRPFGVRLQDNRQRQGI